MSSMAGLPSEDMAAIKARYVQLRTEGYSKDDAMYFAQHPDDHGAPAPFATDYNPSEKELRAAAGEQTPKSHSIALGAANGLTGGFVQEGAAALDTAAQLAKEKLGISSDSGQSAADIYRGKRDAYNRKYQAAKEDNPWTYGLSELSGTIGSAPLVGGIKTAAQAFGKGALLGGVNALGNSNADLTRPDAPNLERSAIDTAIGAGIGAAGGLAGYGIVKGASAAGRSIADRVSDFRRGVPRGTSLAEAELAGQGAQPPAAVVRAAQDAATRVAESPNAPSAYTGQTVKSAFEESQQLEQFYQELGVPLKFTPAQATGSRSAALSELRIRNSGGPAMDLAQSREAAQATQAAQIVDNLVGQVAVDPSALGRPSTSSAITKYVKAGMQAVYRQRSEAAGPLYDQFRQMGGRIDGRPIIAEVQDILAENELNPSAVTSQVASLLEKLQAKSKGGLEIEAANNLRKLMGKVMTRDASFLDGVDMDAQAQMASRIRDSVDKTFDDAAALGSKAAGKSAQGRVNAANNQRAEAIDVLRRANAAWAAGSKAIDDYGPATVTRLIRNAANDPGATESLPSRMLSMEDGQVRAIMRLLNSTSPDTARQVRAQMLEEAFNKFGKPARGSGVIQERGITSISPQAALAKGGLPSMAKAFEAAYEGDPVAQNAWRHSILMLERLRLGPNIRGSTAMPQQEDALRQSAAAIDTIANAAWVPSYVRPILRAISGTAASDKAMAEAMSTTTGIRIFNQALGVAFKARKGIQISPGAATAIMSALTRAGIGVINPPEQTAPPPQGEQPPPPTQPIAQQ